MSYDQRKALRRSLLEKEFTDDYSLNPKIARQGRDYGPQATELLRTVNSKRHDTEIRHDTLEQARLQTAKLDPLKLLEDAIKTAGHQNDDEEYAALMGRYTRGDHILRNKAKEEMADAELESKMYTQAANVFTEARTMADFSTHRIGEVILPPVSLNHTNSLDRSTKYIKNMKDRMYLDTKLRQCKVTVAELMQSIDVKEKEIAEVTVSIERNDREGDFEWQLDMNSQVRGLTGYLEVDREDLRHAHSELTRTEELIAKRYPDMSAQMSLGVLDQKSKIVVKEGLDPLDETNLSCINAAGEEVNLVYGWLLGKMTPKGQVSTMLFGQFTQKMEPPRRGWRFIGGNVGMDDALQQARENRGQVTGVSEAFMLQTQNDTIKMKNVMAAVLNTEVSTGKKFITKCLAVIVKGCTHNEVNGRYLEHGIINNSQVFLNVNGWSITRQQLQEIPEMDIYADGCYAPATLEAGGESVSARMFKRTDTVMAELMRTTKEGGPPGLQEGGAAFKRRFAELARVGNRMVVADHQSDLMHTENIKAESRVQSDEEMLLRISLATKQLKTIENETMSEVVEGEEEWEGAMSDENEDDDDDDHDVEKKETDIKNRTATTAATTSSARAGRSSVEPLSRRSSISEESTVIDEGRQLPPDTILPHGALFTTTTDTNATATASATASASASASANTQHNLHTTTTLDKGTKRQKQLSKTFSRKNHKSGTNAETPGAVLFDPAKKIPTAAESSAQFLITSDTKTGKPVESYNNLDFRVMSTKNIQSQFGSQGFHHISKKTADRVEEEADLSIAVIAAIEEREDVLFALKMEAAGVQNRYITSDERSNIVDNEKALGRLVDILDDLRRCTVTTAEAIGAWARQASRLQDKEKTEKNYLSAGDANKSSRKYAVVLSIKGALLYPQSEGMQYTNNRRFRRGIETAQSSLEVKYVGAFDTKEEACDAFVEAAASVPIEQRYAPYVGMAPKMFIGLRQCGNHYMVRSVGVPPDLPCEQCGASKASNFKQFIPQATDKLFPQYLFHGENYLDKMWIDTQFLSTVMLMNHYFGQFDCFMNPLQLTKSKLHQVMDDIILFASELKQNKDGLAGYIDLKPLNNLRGKYERFRVASEDALRRGKRPKEVTIDGIAYRFPGKRPNLDSALFQPRAEKFMSTDPQHLNQVEALELQQKLQSETDANISMHFGDEDGFTGAFGSGTADFSTYSGLTGGADSGDFGQPDQIANAVQDRLKQAMARLGVSMDTLEAPPSAVLSSLDRGAGALSIQRLQRAMVVLGQSQALNNNFFKAQIVRDDNEMPTGDFSTRPFAATATATASATGNHQMTNRLGSKSAGGTRQKRGRNMDETVETVVQYTYYGAQLTTVQLRPKVAHRVDKVWVRSDQGEWYGTQTKGRHMKRFDRIERIVQEGKRRQEDRAELSRLITKALELDFVAGDLEHVKYIKTLIEKSAKHKGSVLDLDVLKAEKYIKNRRDFILAVKFVQRCYRGYNSRLYVWYLREKRRIMRLKMVLRDKEAANLARIFVPSVLATAVASQTKILAAKFFQIASNFGGVSMVVSVYAKPRGIRKTQNVCIGCQMKSQRTKYDPSKRKKYNDISPCFGTDRYPCSCVMIKGQEKWMVEVYDPVSCKKYYKDFTAQQIQHHVFRTYYESQKLSNMVYHKHMLYGKNFGVMKHLFDPDAHCEYGSDNFESLGQVKIDAAKEYAVLGAIPRAYSKHIMHGMTHLTLTPELSNVYASHLLQHINRPIVVQNIDAVGGTYVADDAPDEVAWQPLEDVIYGKHLFEHVKLIAPVMEKYMFVTRVQWEEARDLLYDHLTGPYEESSMHYEDRRSRLYTDECNLHDAEVLVKEVMKFSLSGLEKIEAEERGEREDWNQAWEGIEDASRWQNLNNARKYKVRLGITQEKFNAAVASHQEVLDHHAHLVAEEARRQQLVNGDRSKIEALKLFLSQTQDCVMSIRKIAMEALEVLVSTMIIPSRLSLESHKKLKFPNTLLPYIREPMKRGQIDYRSGWNVIARKFLLLQPLAALGIHHLRRLKKKTQEKVRCVVTIYKDTMFDNYIISVRTSDDKQVKTEENTMHADFDRKKSDFSDFTAHTQDNEIMVSGQYIEKFLFSKAFNWPENLLQERVAVENTFFDEQEELCRQETAAVVASISSKPGAIGAVEVFDDACPVRPTSRGTSRRSTRQHPGSSTNTSTSHQASTLQHQYQHQHQQSSGRSGASTPNPSRPSSSTRGKNDQSSNSRSHLSASTIPPSLTPSSSRAPSRPASRHRDDEATHKARGSSRPGTSSVSSPRGTSTSTTHATSEGTFQEVSPILPQISVPAGSDSGALTTVVPTSARASSRAPSRASSRPSSSSSRPPAPAGSPAGSTEIIVGEEMLENDVNESDDVHTAEEIAVALLKGAGNFSKAREHVVDNEAIAKINICDNGRVQTERLKYANQNDDVKLPVFTVQVTPVIYNSLACRTVPPGGYHSRHQRQASEQEQIISKVIKYLRLHPHSLRPCLGLLHFHRRQDNIRTIADKTIWFRDMIRKNNSSWMYSEFCKDKTAVVCQREFVATLRDSYGEICVRLRTPFGGKEYGAFESELVVPFKRIVQSMVTKPLLLASFLCETITNSYSDDLIKHILGSIDLILPGEENRWWRRVLVQERTPTIAYIDEEHDKFRGAIFCADKFVSGKYCSVKVFMSATFDLKFMFLAPLDGLFWFQALQPENEITAIITNDAIKYFLLKKSASPKITESEREFILKLSHPLYMHQLIHFLLKNIEIKDKVILRKYFYEDEVTGVQKPFIDSYRNNNRGGEDDGDSDCESEASGSPSLYGFEMGDSDCGSVMSEDDLEDANEEEAEEDKADGLTGGHQNEGVASELDVTQMEVVDIDNERTPVLDDDKLSNMQQQQQQQQQQQESVDLTNEKGNDAADSVDLLQHDPRLLDMSWRQRLRVKVWKCIKKFNQWVVQHNINITPLSSKFIARIYTHLREYDCPPEWALIDSDGGYSGRDEAETLTVYDGFWPTVDPRLVVRKPVRIDTDYLALNSASVFSTSLVIDPDTGFNNYKLPAAEIVFKGDVYYRVKVATDSFKAQVKLEIHETEFTDPSAEVEVHRIECQQMMLEDEASRASAELEVEMMLLRDEARIRATKPAIPPSYLEDLVNARDKNETLKVTLRRLQHEFLPLIDGIWDKAALNSFALTTSTLAVSFDENKNTVFHIDSEVISSKCKKFASFSEKDPKVRPTLSFFDSIKPAAVRKASKKERKAIKSTPKAGEMSLENERIFEEMQTWLTRILTELRETKDVIAKPTIAFQQSGVSTKAYPGAGAPRTASMVDGFTSADGVNDVMSYRPTPFQANTYRTNVSWRRVRPLRHWELGTLVSLDADYLRRARKGTKPHYLRYKGRVWMISAPNVGPADRASVSVYSPGTGHSTVVGFKSNMKVPFIRGLKYFEDRNVYEEDVVSDDEAGDEGNDGINNVVAKMTKSVAVMSGDESDLASHVDSMSDGEMDDSDADSGDELDDVLPVAGGIIRITQIECSNLRSVVVVGKNDPFVSLTYGAHLHVQTSVAKGAGDATSWEINPESHSLYTQESPLGHMNMEVNMDDLRSLDLEIEVFNSNKLTKPTPIGAGRVSLGAYLASRRWEDKVAVVHLTDAKKREAGEVLVHFEFIEKHVPVPPEQDPKLVLIREAAERVVWRSMVHGITAAAVKAAENKLDIAYRALEEQVAVKCTPWFRHSRLITIIDKAGNLEYSSVLERTRTCAEHIASLSSPQQRQLIPSTTIATKTTHQDTHLKKLIMKKFAPRSLKRMASLMYLDPMPPPPPPCRAVEIRFYGLYVPADEDVFPTAFTTTCGGAWMDKCMEFLQCGASAPPDKHFTFPVIVYTNKTSPHTPSGDAQRDDSTQVVVNLKLSTFVFEYIMQLGWRKDGSYIAHRKHLKHERIYRNNFNVFDQSPTLYGDAVVLFRHGEADFDLMQQWCRQRHAERVEMLERRRQKELHEHNMRVNKFKMWRSDIFCLASKYGPLMEKYFYCHSNSVKYVPEDGPFNEAFEMDEDGILRANSYVGCIEHHQGDPFAKYDRLQWRHLRLLFLRYSELLKSHPAEMKHSIQMMDQDYAFFNDEREYVFETYNRLAFIEGEEFLKFQWNTFDNPRNLQYQTGHILYALYLGHCENCCAIPGACPIPGCSIIRQMARGQCFEYDQLHNTDTKEGSIYLALRGCGYHPLELATKKFLLGMTTFESIFVMPTLVSPMVDVIVSAAPSEATDGVRDMQAKRSKRWRRQVEEAKKFRYLHRRVIQPAWRSYLSAEEVLEAKGGHDDREENEMTYADTAKLSFFLPPPGANAMMESAYLYEEESEMLVQAQSQTLAAPMAVSRVLDSSSATATITVSTLAMRRMMGICQDNIESFDVCSYDPAPPREDLVRLWQREGIAADVMKTNKECMSTDLFHWLLKHVRVQRHSPVFDPVTSLLGVGNSGNATAFDYYLSRLNEESVLHSGEQHLVFDRQQSQGVVRSVDGELLFVQVLQGVAVGESLRQDQQSGRPRAAKRFVSGDEVSGLSEGLTVSVHHLASDVTICLVIQDRKLDILADNFKVGRRNYPLIAEALFANTSTLIRLHQADGILKDISLTIPLKADVHSLKDTSLLMKMPLKDQYKHTSRRCGAVNKRNGRLGAAAFLLDVLEAEVHND